MAATATKRGRRPPAPLTEAAKRNEAFDMSTPEGALRRHFIGTPSAAGILSAFLDVEDAADDGPPLDPDYDSVTARVASAPCTPAAMTPTAISPGAEASKLSPSNESASSRSTHAGELAEGGHEEESEEDEYEDDFEACSGASDAEDEPTNPRSPSGSPA